MSLKEKYCIDRISVHTHSHTPLANDVSVKSTVAATYLFLLWFTLYTAASLLRFPLREDNAALSEWVAECCARQIQKYQHYIFSDF